MKKTILFITLILTINTFSQNKLIEGKAFIKTLQFDTPIEKSVAIANFLAANGLDANTTFETKKTTTDPSGISHQRYMQFYKKTKVEFGTIIVHSKNNLVTSISGEVYNPKNTIQTPIKNSQECFELALNQINAIEYLWDNKQQADLLEYRKPTGQLVYFPNVNTGQIKLAYMFDIYATNPISRQEIYIDTQTGATLYSNPIIKHAHDIENKINLENQNEKFSNLVIGTANTKYSGIRNIETTFNNSLTSYVLNDVTRGKGIVTFNCERLINSYQDVHFKDNDNNWTLAEHNNSFFDNAAQDAHWASMMTYDFWKNIFNRASYDDNNARIKSYIHFQRTTQSMSNAFWNGIFMTYGDGNQKPFSTIDIVGHEIGHAICSYTANLAYRNQSGGLNEGFSDIWGACIEHYGRTGSMAGTPVANVWKIGEDCQSGGGLRSMSTPNSKNDPDTFRGSFWVGTADDSNCIATSQNDWCGVHTNSGVLNHWFYILSAGKSGTNNAPLAEQDVYNVTGIGIQKAAEIAYLVERDYLTPNSTFFDARESSIIVANNLYCQRAPEVIAVTNAWNAVNVGEKHVNYPIDLYQKSIPQLSSVACGATSFYPTISFQNIGINAVTNVVIEYNINNGPNTTINWTGSLLTCSSASIPLNINITGFARGVYKLNVKTTLVGDGDLTNNTKSTSILVNNPTVSNAINTFENTSDNLVSYDEFSTNSIWERGISSKTTLVAPATAGKVYATKQVGAYTANQKAYLVSQCYDLTQVTNPTLKFDMAFDIESNVDVLYMQYSINGGTTWSLLGSINDEDWYSSNNSCTLCVGGEWSGEGDLTNISLTTNGTMREYKLAMPQFGLGGATPQSSLILRYVFNTDNENELDGVLIDNFRIVSNNLSTNNNPFKDFSIAPNPANDFVNISFDSQTNEFLEIQLIDIQGRIVTFQKFESLVGTSNFRINTERLPAGFYILNVKQGTKVFKNKLVKI